MKRRILDSLLVIVLMSLSVYLTAGAAGQTQVSGSGPLTLYHLDSKGNPTVAVENLFTSGEQIWVAIPQGDFWAYWLSVYNDRGSQIWNQTGSSIPSDNLLPLVLGPNIFPPDHDYQVTLRVFQGTLPGMGIAQSYATSFMVAPGLGRLLLESFSRTGGIDESHVKIVDMNGNPKASVRLGLFLDQEGSSVQLTTESTDTHGRAVLRSGEALAAGSYSLEVRSLDASVPSSPLHVSDFSVQVKPTVISAAQTTSGIRATLLRAGGQYPIEGRLLLLEQQLTDGNWTISASAYTDATGQVGFPAPAGSGAWRVQFKGDIFFGSSSSDSSSSFFAPNGSTASPQLAYSYASGSLGVVASTVIATTTNLYLPASAYGTIPAILAAGVKDSSGNPVPSVTVWFYKDGGSIGTSVTNSTGYAAFVWTANVTGTHTMQAAFLGNTNYGGSVSAQQSFTINQTPTTIMILKPQTIAYSWDVFSYYSGNGRPIVVPIVTLALAAFNNSGPSGIYIPPFNGNSSTPTHISGYGWAGLNQSSAVTVSYNTTYTQTQSMNWTMNFYMPPCPTPPSCSSTPRTGHMYLSASLAPPNTLYTSASTSLNIPYQNVNTVSTASSQLSQDSTPPANLYVGVNATYPYISLKMQGTSVALEAYVAWLAYTLGGPTSSTVNCPRNGSCYNYYSLPLLNTTLGSDFAYACMSTGCTTPAANVVLNLYNSKGQLCISSTTDNRGIAQLNFVGSKSCTYPYYYLGTPSTNVILSELFAVEAVSKPYPFYTNFQGYNYAIYAPQRATRYLLSLHAYFQTSTFTVIYPATSYPDVQQAFASCCDIFLNVQKHPVQVNVGVTPGTATVIDNVNASIILTDQAEGKHMPSASVTYSLKRTDPNPTTLTSGTITTGPKGNATLTLGKLSYGSYTLTVSWAGNSTSIASSYQANFTIWRARTIIIISPGWIHATVGNPYLFTTTLLDNATKSIIALSGLVEQVYINGALYSNTELCTTSGCSMASYYLTNPGGNVTFPWRPSGAGQYFINATFSQQNYYPSTSFQIEASVTLRPVLLVAVNSPFQPHTNDLVTWTIQAYDLLDNASVVGLSITPYINGSSYPAVTTDTTGHATFPNTFTSPGFYNVTFTSAATTVYNSATTQNSLKVFTPTTLTISGGTVYLGQQNSLSVTLKDNVGNPLGGRTVQIKINGASFTTVTTGSNGQASFNWQPTSLGNYTVAASYSPAGPSDAGFQPSSASIMVNIKPLTIVNTQSTGSGTQSLTLNTAQGSAATGGAFSYSFQFSPGSATVTLQFNGRQSQSTVNTWNEFGWICVARVFGACVLSVPYWKVHTDMGVPGVFDLHLASFMPFGPTDPSFDLSLPNPVDEIATEIGVVAAGACPIIGITFILAAQAASLETAEGIIWVGGLLVAACLAAAVLAAVAAYGFSSSLKSFLLGMIGIIPAGIACSIGYCPPEVPPLPVVEAALAAIYAWGILLKLLLIPFVLEGILATIVIGVVLLLAALMYVSL